MKPWVAQPEIPFRGTHIFYPVHKGDKPLRKEEIAHIFAELHRMRDEFAEGITEWCRAMKENTYDR